MTAGLKLYAGLMRLLHGVAPGLLQGRVAKGKEDSVRWPERLGKTTTARPDGQIVWFHGVSVG
jgi:3-deoxy-D-manno-octulosonic-acid transferase